MMESTQTDSMPTPMGNELYNRHFDFSEAREILNRLIVDWQPECNESDKRRRERDFNVSVERLRTEGKLKSDETIVPERMIDTNIRREQPPYIAYLTQSRRRAIFKDSNTVAAMAIENAFSKGMSYLSWEIPFFKVLDGAATHGWDAVQITYDPAKPLHVGIEHISHNKLFFPLEALDIQTCENILIGYDVTTSQLRSWVTLFGFSADAVEQVINAKGVSVSKEIVHPIFKRLHKYEGFVYVSWYSKEADTWLKAPEKLFMGRRDKSIQMMPQVSVDPSTGMNISMLAPQEISTDVYESEYPLEILPYFVTEQPRIFDYKGRVFLDRYKQEAATAIWSSYVNGMMRASNLYGSPKNSSGGVAPKQSDTRLEHGALYTEPVDFWAPPYPSPDMLKATQALETQNAQETNQVAWAVNNRQDSRKTATEISAASRQEALINTVQVTLFSIFLRKVYGRVWAIVRNLATQGEIILEGVNPEWLIIDFQILSAGDVDVIQRQEKLERIGQILPMAGAWPALQSMMFSDLLRIAFPEDGERYAQAMMQTDPTQLLAALATILQSVLTPEEVAALPPEQQQQLAIIGQQVQQTIQQRQEMTNGTNSNIPRGNQQQSGGTGASATSSASAGE